MLRFYFLFLTMCSGTELGLRIRGADFAIDYVWQFWPLAQLLN